MTILDARPLPELSATPVPLPRTDPITQLPILILFPHSRCNCRCIMCDIWRATTRDELGTEEVAAWLDDWRTLGVRRVVLSGGEALMHSDLWALCDVLRSAGIGITVLSTGMVLQRHAAQLVEYCDDVVVSLDGPPAVHDAIRNVPRAFERLAAGVAALRAASATIAISARCTVQRMNHHVIGDTVRSAREIGFDRISFLAADVSTDAFNRPEGWETSRVAEIALGEREIATLRSELVLLEQAHAADFASGFISESPDKLRRRLLQYYEALLGVGEFAPNECNAPWVSSVIEADGTVRPCFFQPPLGNIRTAGSLGAVLNSPDAVAWRQALDPHRDAICRKCVCTLSLSASPSP